MATHTFRVPLPSGENQRFSFKLTAVGLGTVVYVIKLATRQETREGTAAPSSVLQTYIERVGNQDYVNCTFRANPVPRQLRIEGRYESSPLGWVLINLNTCSRPLNEAELDKYSRLFVSYKNATGAACPIGVFASRASSVAGASSAAGTAGLSSAAGAAGASSVSGVSSAASAGAQKRTSSSAFDAAIAAMTSNEGLESAFVPGSHESERFAKRAYKK
jgi:hypothetical protein